MFSYGSSSSISFATVTPSLVTVGEPNFLSMTTLRPFGPSVATTARESFCTPRSNACRACSSNTNCFAAIILFQFLVKVVVEKLFKDRDQVVRVENLVFLAVNLDLGAAVFGDEHAVALLHFERDAFAIFVQLAGAEHDDDAFLRFFFGGVRNDDAAL